MKLILKTFLSIVLLTVVISATAQETKIQQALNNSDRKSILTALHIKFKEETNWKFILRLVKRKNNWAIIKATPQQVGNNYETMTILVKQSAKDWNILAIADPSAGEDGEPTFFQTCLKKYPAVPKAIFTF